ncbi:MAG TPA: hypothetical protein VHB98_16690, partial [Chloroflexota bacterium]|nr:hypothetical protein [Chloroflexota bacterium]
MRPYFLVRRAAESAQPARGRSRRLPVLAVLLAVLALALVRPGLARAGSGGASLAPGFGTGGTVVTDINNHSDDTAAGVAIQPDHKIVVAGTTGTDPNFRVALVRYNPDGSLDKTFGSNHTGIVIGSNWPAGVTDPQTDAVALQQVNGQTDIVVAGNGTVNAFLVRYNPDGSLDTTFGTGGLMIFNFAGAGDGTAIEGGIAVQPDGKIVVNGFNNTDLAVARVKAGGSGLDTGFGSNGSTKYDWGNPVGDIPSGVAIQSTGEIVVSGTHDDNGDNHFGLARFSTTGTLNSATTTIITSASESAEANAIAVASDDTIAEAGSDGTNFAVVTYHSDGTLAGKTTTSWGQNAAATAVAFQPNDQIVAAGLADTTHGTIGVARYNTDLSLDNSFGTGGKTTANFASGSRDQVNGMAIGPDGIVVAGSTLLPSRSDEDVAAALFVSGLTLPPPPGNLVGTLVSRPQATAPTKLLIQIGGSTIAVAVGTGTQVLNAALQPLALSAMQDDDTLQVFSASNTTSTGLIDATEIIDLSVPGTTPPPPPTTTVMLKGTLALAPSAGVLCLSGVSVLANSGPQPWAATAPCGATSHLLPIYVNSSTVYYDINHNLITVNGLDVGDVLTVKANLVGTQLIATEVDVAAEETPPPPTTVTVEGVLDTVSPAGILCLVGAHTVSSFAQPAVANNPCNLNGNPTGASDLPVYVNSSTVYLDPNGNATTSAYLRPTDTLRVTGSTATGVFLATTVQDLSTHVTPPTT